MSRFERLRALVVAVLCVVYAGTLRDSSLPRLLLLGIEAPALPAKVSERPGRLVIDVRDERGAIVQAATITVLSIFDRKAYLLGGYESDDDGRVRVTGVPIGEVWVLTEAEGRQRASMRLQVGAGVTEARVVLRRASTLVVQAVDDEHRPVPGAKVEVRDGDALPHLAETGADGSVAVGRLGPPPYAVVVRAQGFEDAGRAGVHPGLLPLRLTMRGLCTLLVDVVTQQGEAAAGAEVRLVGPRLFPARKAQADEQGQLRVSSIAAGTYSIAASKGELVSAPGLSATVKRGEASRVKIVLEQGRMVQVRVVTEGESSQRIAGANVVLTEEGISSFPREAVTDEGGMATLGPVSGKGPALSARASGFVPRVGVKVPDEGEVVQIELSRGATLLGEVVDKRGDAVAGATIEIIGTDRAGMPIDETPQHSAFRNAHFWWALSGPQALLPMGELGVMPGPVAPIPRNARGEIAVDGPQVGIPVENVEPWVSDERGAFRVTPLPAGRVRAIVRHPGYVEGISEAVSLAPGAAAHVRVVLREGGAIEGRVVDTRGQPVGGARVEIAALEGTLVRSAVTADDGTFAFASVPSALSIGVARPEAIDELVLRKTISIGDGDKKEVTLVLPEAREKVSVRVRDDRGYPVSFAQVTAVSLEQGTPLRVTRFSSDDGVAELPDAADLPLRIEVSRPGFAPLKKTFERAAVELEVTLLPGTTVSGEVRARGGRDPVEGAEVTVVVAGVTRHAKTSSGGEFLLRDLPEGPARISAHKAGHARAERQIVLPKGERDRVVTLERLELAEAGTVEGDVVDAEGNPVVAARVGRAPLPQLLPLGALPPGMVTTDSHGRFTLDDLPEGDVEIEAFSPDRGRSKLTVRVVADRVVRDARLKLDPDAADDAVAAGGVAVTLVEKGEKKGKRRVVVRQVARGSEAERAGLQQDDVLVAIDGQGPSSLADARRRLSGPIGEDVLVDVQREGEAIKLRVPRERLRR